jgi:EpsD family peptidyl-prolyl cis-trans isomerase
LNYINFRGPVPLPKTMRRVATLLVLLPFVAGCGKDAAQKPTTQVAAKVNDDEITIHQVNVALARTPNLSAEAAERGKREILERLIDQQLAVQQAIGKKLDRSAPVQQALAAARSEILARAYFEQIASEQAKPSDEETKRYYAEHPELFAQRRVFILEEIAATLSPDQRREARARASKARGMKEIADWLQSQSVAFAPSRGVRAAEQLPMDLLPRLQAAKGGEILVVEGPENRVQLIRVVASKAEPVDEAVAAPRIQQFLRNRRVSEAIASEKKQLRAGAKIDYAGEFVSNAAAAVEKANILKAEKAKANESLAKEEAEAQARAAATTKARLAAEARLNAERARTENAPPALSKESMHKGIGGLK